MAKLETFRTNEDGYLLVLVKIVEKEEFLVFLLDPWKAGYRDFQIHKGDMKSLKREIGLPSIKFQKIEKNAAARLLYDNYEIAEAVGVDIPENAKAWFSKLGVFKLSSLGSLYKCFNCQSGDLNDDDIRDILAIAKSEVGSGKIGNEGEEQYFYICEDCKQEMHESHT